jgi:hypothetical protein
MLGLAIVEAWEMWNFLTILLLTFALFLVLTGAFTAYFGSGKSRKIGGGLLAGGLIIGILWVYLVGIANTISDVKVWDLFVQSLGILIAAIIGALLAVGLFLLAIMKS